MWVPWLFLFYFAAKNFRMAETIIDISNANIYQGDSLVLQDVNLTVTKGEFVYLVGKTGTGKSSLLKTLYGELPLKQGDASVVGYDIKKLTWKTVPYLRRNLGVVFQDFQLLTDRNVNENLKFVLRATGWKDDKLMNEKIADVLDKVGLKSKGFKMPFEMSGGEQQRVVNDPALFRFHHTCGKFLDHDIIVSSHHHCRTVIAGNVNEQLHDLIRSFRIQVTSWLVGQDQFR